MAALHLCEWRGVVTGKRGVTSERKGVWLVKERGVVTRLRGGGVRRGVVAERVSGGNLVIWWLRGAHQIYYIYSACVEHGDCTITSLMFKCKDCL